MEPDVQVSDTTGDDQRFEARKKNILRNYETSLCN